jgi:hypothetical protein
MPRKRDLVSVIVGTAVVVGLTGAAAMALALQAPHEGERKCGTPGLARPPARSPDGSNTPGRRGMPGAFVPVAEMPPPGETASDPGGAGSGESAPAGSQSPPSPAPLPPPPLPGLPPANTASEESSKTRVEAIQAKGEVPEERLLDIGVQIFDPGAGEEDRQDLARRGLSPELRRSEARYVAFHLKKTLESTGNWGAVRVVPGPGEGLDVFVSGRILESNGKRLALEVDADDATGRRWLHRRYKGEADLSAYRTERVGRYEAFQEVYNRIANDLLASRDDRDAAELAVVRQVAGLRFAAALSPEAFSAYLKPAGSGRFRLLRLPAADDPMVARVSAIRDRDQMFVDTLNEHYLNFYEQMTGPYANWRMYSYQEQDALDRIRRESMLKKILGGVAIIAGMMMDTRSQAERAAADLAVFGGMAALESGFRQAKEKDVHVAALKELATSFDGEVAPLLVEVEGQQLKLTGSAETQFASWRELLRRVFGVETGVPGDPNAVSVTAGPASR